MDGFCPTVLSHIEALAGCNPAKKLSPLGFTQAILSQQDENTRATVNGQYSGGHVNGGLKIAYQRRPSLSDVSDSAQSCEAAKRPAKLEFGMPSLLHREISFFLDDALIRQYCKDASDMITIPTGGGDAIMNGEPTSVMREVYDNLIIYGGTLLHSVNMALVTAMATEWGVNVVTGNANATPLTFTLGENGMADAFVTLMTHIRENEICDTDSLAFVGNGPFANIDLIRKWFADAAAGNGINKAAMLASFPGVFFDKDTRAIWGNNQVGVFEKGSLALISWLKNTGSFARKLANSSYFSMALPVDEYCCPQEHLDKLMFDVQVREIDCPTEIEINGVVESVGPGVQVTLSKDFNLFVRPDTLYATGDPLEGTNGTLRYAITTP